MTQHEQHKQHGQHNHAAPALRHTPQAPEQHAMSQMREQASPEVAVHGSQHAAHATHTGPANQSDHSGHAGHSEAMFARPFWISLVLTIPVLVYGHLFQELLGYTAPRFPGSRYLPFVLGSIIYWYGGWVFLSSAVGELKNRAPGMMTLVALAISTAYLYSVAATFGLVSGMDFYW